jgi:hypothetical protein
LPTKLCPKHLKTYPCGNCRIESAKRPAQAAPLGNATSAEVDEAKRRMYAPLEDSSPIPDEVLAHTCGYKNCQCKKEFTRAEAIEKVRVGEADWWTPPGSRYPVRSAIELRMGGKSGRISDANCVGVSWIEANTEARMKLGTTDYQLTASINDGGRPVARVAELSRALETWPEFAGIPFVGDELFVWTNSILCADQDDFVALAEELAKRDQGHARGLAEIERVFQNADAKIKTVYHECKITKRGIFAAWKNLPNDFRELPVANIEIFLHRYKTLITTAEFKRLDYKEQAAVSAWVEARCNYRDAAATLRIAETTLKTRVKRGFDNLKIAAASSSKSQAFLDLFNEIFAGTASTVADDMANVATIASTGGGEIGGRIISSKRREVYGRLVTEPLDTFERGFVTHVWDGVSVKDGEAANRRIDFDDHSESSKP